MVPIVMTWPAYSSPFAGTGVTPAMPLQHVPRSARFCLLQDQLLAIVPTMHYLYMVVIILLVVALLVSIRNGGAISVRRSREQFRNIDFRNKFDKMLEGVEIIGFNWQYLYVNEAYERQVRMRRDELLGYTIMEKFPGIEQTDIYLSISRCFQERIPIHLVDSFTFADNVTRWFEISFQPVPEGVFILSNDITEYKASEDALRKSLRDVSEYKERNKQSEKIYKTIASSIPGSAICLVDRDLRYFLVEGEMLTRMGYSSDELLGNKIQDIATPAQLRELMPHFERVFAGESFSVENETAGFDVLSKYVPFRDEDDHVIAAMIVILDVSELKTAQRALANLNAKLEDKIRQRTAELETVNRELEAFSYSVAHDLRTPLRAIYGYSTILEEDYGSVLDTEGKRLITRVVHNAKRMGTLIDDLLTFTRLGRKEIHRSRIDMNYIVESCISDLNLGESYPGTITVGDLHPVMADLSLIKYVMLNLLSNAVKYSSKKNQPRIDIASEKKDSAIVYSVKDNGVGFDMEYADKLFGIFQRLHSSDEFEGTGVGLAVVQRIIHRHQGDVWAQGKVDHGATFYVSLPGL